MAYRVIRTSAPQTCLWLLPDGNKAWGTHEELRSMLRESAMGRLGWRIEGEPHMVTGNLSAPLSGSVRFCRATFDADEAIRLTRSETDFELVKCAASSEWVKWVLVAGAGALIVAVVSSAIG